mmetsp:Transcript_6967/g.24775  ORF Transcript_6967/g.24775 Transcript_6967/m.24775 type:complete len:270 (+) Transcript_6967:908-1717(+)
MQPLADAGTRRRPRLDPRLPGCRGGTATIATAGRRVQRTGEGVEHGVGVPHEEEEAPDRHVVQHEHALSQPQAREDGALLPDPRLAPHKDEQRVGVGLDDAAERGVEAGVELERHLRTEVDVLGGVDAERGEQRGAVLIDGGVRRACAKVVVRRRSWHGRLAEPTVGADRAAPAANVVRREKVEGRGAAHEEDLLRVCGRRVGGARAERVTRREVVHVGQTRRRRVALAARTAGPATTTWLAAWRRIDGASGQQRCPQLRRLLPCRRRR